MSFIVFGGAEYVSIVTDTDGNNKVFDIGEGAEIEATECQDGLVVDIG